MHIVIIDVHLSFIRWINNNNLLNILTNSVDNLRFGISLRTSIISHEWTVFSHGKVKHKKSNTEENLQFVSVFDDKFPSS